MAELQHTLVTKEGLEKLQKELDELRTKTRGEVAQRLKEAIAMGDLSENSEYDDAKNEQGLLEARIAEINRILSEATVAEIIDSGKKGRKSRVDVGMTVTIEALEDHVEETVKIVGSTESDPFEGKISNESPVGRALMGAKAGDIVEAEAPSGVVKYKVIKIKA